MALNLLLPRLVLVVDAKAKDDADRTRTARRAVLHVVKAEVVVNVADADADADADARGQQGNNKHHKTQRRRDRE